MPSPNKKDDIDDEGTSESSEEEQVNPLDLSDEDFDSFLMKDLEDIKDSEDEDNDSDNDEDDDSDDSGDTDDKSDDNQDDTDDSDDANTDDTPDKIEESSKEVDIDKETNAKDVSEDIIDSKGDKSKSTPKDDKTEKTSDNINYEDEYKKLLAPFRANNKDMEIDNVEDARTLMQMGANYNKKMAGLKPNLKLIKMLDNHNLLDESKLSFLIDLSKNDPNAIKKLVKDSGVEVAEFDNEEEVKYKSNKTYTVDDREVELDGVLDDIKDTPSFKDTIDIISNKWDESSRSTLIERPDIIKTINAHVEAGIYEKIQQGIDQQRMLGKLNGVSDLDAYKQVGDELNAAGAFNNATPESNGEKTTKKTSRKDDSQLKSRKKAASTTKSTTSSKKNSDDYNPLNMSDEDFAKNSSSKFF